MVTKFFLLSSDTSLLYNGNRIFLVTQNGRRRVEKKGKKCNKNQKKILARVNKGRKKGEMRGWEQKRKGKKHKAKTKEERKQNKTGD